MSKQNKNQTTDRILVLCAILLIVFTIAVLTIFAFTGNEPSTLVTCFFATFGVAEGGFCTWIWTKKRKDSKDERRRSSEDSIESCEYSECSGDVLFDSVAEDES